MPIRNLTSVTLALGLTFLGGAANTPVVRGGLTDVMISPGQSILLPPSPHPAILRAAEDLQRFLARRHTVRLSIETGTESPGIRLAMPSEAEADHFEIRSVPEKGQIQVSGSNPRSVYRGVLLLEEHLAEAPSLSAVFQAEVRMPFQDRYLIWDSLLTGQNKEAVGFDPEQHVREAVRLGYTGMECNRFVGARLTQQGNPRDPYPWFTYWGPSMDQFVTSPLFEGVFPKDNLARNLTDLKRLAALVRSFGLKPIFTGYEPRFVPQSFLEQRPDLRGPRVDHPLRSMTPRYSLCTDRPEVLEHYRTLARQLAKEVSDIEEMFVIFHDSGAGLCWEKGLYSGRNGPEFCRDIPTGERMRKFFSAIREGWREGGREIRLVAQPHGNSRSEFDEFLDDVPREIDLTAGNWASWSLVYPDPLGIDRHVLDRQRETSRRRIYYQQHFFGFDVAPVAEFPAPYYLADRLHKAFALDLDLLNTLGGIVSPPITRGSGMQEVYRQFLLSPETSAAELVVKAAVLLGGTEGGRALVSIWQEIDAVLRENENQIGFAMGTEFASRRTLVRPLVPDASALLPQERDWWQAYTFGGDLRYGHAHLFRGEGGLPSQDWYLSNRDRSNRAATAFRNGSTRLRNFTERNPAEAGRFPYLVQHERQLRFLAHVYLTGAHLYEGQRILDRYSKKSIEDDLKAELAADTENFVETVKAEIENCMGLLSLVKESGDFGMILLQEETTWGFTGNFGNLLEKKVDIMQRHLPEIDEVLSRWFDSEY